MAAIQSPLSEKKGKPGRRYVQLDVTRLASGADLRLGLHVATGQKDGPTLGILTTIHGDETFPLMAIRELLNAIDVKSLAGRVAAVPVANRATIGNMSPEFGSTCAIFPIDEETLTYLHENDYFGEMALVDRGLRSARATAVGATILGRIDRATWELLLHLAPNEVMGNFTRSVTQRLRQNNQHFIEQMMRSERLSLLGTTISSIVHDMNNPISTVLGACQVIQSNSADQLTVQMAGLIREAIDSMETMTRELVDFSPILAGFRYVRAHARLRATVFLKFGNLIIGPSWVLFTVMGQNEFAVHWRGIASAPCPGLAAAPRT